MENVFRKLFNDKESIFLYNEECFSAPLKILKEKNSPKLLKENNCI